METKNSNGGRAFFSVENDNVGDKIIEEYGDSI
jgi:hypothetical protein